MKLYAYPIENGFGYEYETTDREREIIADYFVPNYDLRQNPFVEDHGQFSSVDCYWPPATLARVTEFVNAMIKNPYLKRIDMCLLEPDLLSDNALEWLVKFRIWILDENEFSWAQQDALDDIERRLIDRLRKRAA